MLISLSKTKLVILISSVVFFSSMFTAIAANKVITLKLGQSITIDDIVISCQAPTDTNTDTNTEANVDTNTDTNTEANVNTNSDSNSAIDEKTEMSKQAKALQTELCNGLKFNKDKKECLSIEVTHLDKEALNICKNLRYSNDRNKCLKAIANKVYVEGDLNKARNKRYAEKRVAFLEASGEVVK